jgi:hypothetical protein
MKMEGYFFTFSVRLTYDLEPMALRNEQQGKRKAPVLQK